jgi:hypothetical protein
VVYGVPSTDLKFGAVAPFKEVKLATLEFNKEERQVYDMVEKKTQDVINRYLQRGSVLK